MSFREHHQRDGNRDTAVAEPGAPEAAVAPERRLQLGMAGSGALRWVAVDVTDIVREVRDRLDMTPVAAAAFGRAVAGAAPLPGPAPQTPRRPGLGLPGAGPPRPVPGAGDPARHQRGAGREPPGGGPGSNLATMPGVRWLLEEGGVDRVLGRALAGLDRELKETGPLRYLCRCSRERLQRHLVLLSADDRDYLAEEDGAIEADCVFCGNHYRFTSDELIPEEEQLPTWVGRDH